MQPTWSYHNMQGKASLVHIGFWCMYWLVDMIDTLNWTQEHMAICSFGWLNKHMRRIQRNWYVMTCVSIIRDLILMYMDRLYGLMEDQAALAWMVSFWRMAPIESTPTCHWILLLVDGKIMLPLSLVSLEEDGLKAIVILIITSGSTCWYWSELCGFGWLHEEYERGIHMTSGFGKTM